jgi:uncharacterized damage-inducible protein DinB
MCVRWRGYFTPALAEKLVLHLTAWTVEVSSRLRGTPAGLPAIGDWAQPPDEPSEAAWSSAQRELHVAHSALLELVASFDSARLSELAGAPRDRALGTGTTHAALFLGVAQHAAYHAGQVAVLKRSLS